MALLHDYFRQEKFYHQALFVGNTALLHFLWVGILFNSTAFGNSFMENFATLQFQNEAWWNLLVRHKHV